MVYSAEKPDLGDNLEPEGKLKVGSTRGDTEAAFATAPVKIDETYVTPVETHNAMELHASVSIWDGSKFTLYETTQGVINHRAVMAQILGVPKENVQVTSRFLGSGFGGKLFPWPHSALAAAASRALNRPVKLVISRGMMFSNVGHRPLTQQRVRLAATRDGKLVSLQHDYVNQTSILDNYEEIDVTFLDYPDFVLNEYGARGVGEIGLAGIAAAIASAVYHASGVRIRRLPVKIEDLLGARAAT